MKQNGKIGGLLLAAGGSTRFGSPKQLARFRGKTLLRTAAEAIAAAECHTAVAVLGSKAEEMLAELSGLDVKPVINTNWHSGMSSSIKTGLNALLDLEPSLDAVLITLMDQPLVTAKHLVRFIERLDVSANTLPAGRVSARTASIIAAEYNGIVGVPALFSRDHFDELLALTGDKGARAIIRDKDDVITISLEEAAIDVDTANDLERQIEEYF